MPATKHKTYEPERSVGETLLESLIALTHIPAFIGRRRIADGHVGHLSDEQIAAILQDANERFGIPADWVAVDIIPTVSDVAVVHVGTKSEPLQAFLKIAQSAAGHAGLDSQSATLTALHADRQLGEWRSLIPVELAHGRLANKGYSIEAAMPGVEMTALKQSDLWTRAMQDAAIHISQLHRVHGSLRIVDDQLFDQWCSPALNLLSTLKVTCSAERLAFYIDRLRNRLHDGLIGKQVWTSRIHGDFSPNNVLVDADSGSVTGIIDWDRSKLDQPSFLDVAQLALGAANETSGAHIGGIVRALCAGSADLPAELKLLDDSSHQQVGDRIDISVVALMTWLRHIESNVNKAPRYADHRLWVYRAVQTVLKGCCE